MLGFPRPAFSEISVFGYALPARFAVWAVRLWIAAVVVGSLLPGPAKATFGATPHAVNRRVNYKHRALHVLTFGSTYFLVSLLALDAWDEIAAAGEVLALAGLIELAQDILYAHGKTFEWWDVRDDAIGILIAFLAVRIIRSRSVRSKTG